MTLKFELFMFNVLKFCNNVNFFLGGGGIYIFLKASRISGRRFRFITKRATNFEHGIKF